MKTETAQEGSLEGEESDSLEGEESDSLEGEESESLEGEESSLDDATSGLGIKERWILKLIIEHSSVFFSLEGLKSDSEQDKELQQVNRNRILIKSQLINVQF